MFSQLKYSITRLSYKTQAWFDTFLSSSASLAKSDANAFFQTLVEQLNRKRPAYLIAAYDYDFLISNILLELDIEKRAVKSELKSYKANSTCYLCDRFSQKGEAKLLRVVDDPKEEFVSAMIRMDNYEVFYDYVEILAKRGKHFQIVDCKPLGFGYYLSDIYRYLLKMSNYQSSPNGEMCLELREHIFSGDWESSINLYNQLSEHDKDNLLLKHYILEMALEGGHTQYIQQLKSEIGLSFPEQNYFSLWSFPDHFKRKKDLESLLLLVDEITNFYGLNDGGIAHMNANICKSYGDFDQAIYFSDRALEVEPSLKAALFTQAEVYNSRKMYNELIEVLERLKREFEHPLHIENIPEYKSFLESKQYKLWNLMNNPYMLR